MSTAGGLGDAVAAVVIIALAGSSRWHVICKRLRVRAPNAQGCDFTEFLIGRDVSPVRKILEDFCISS